MNFFDGLVVGIIIGFTVCGIYIKFSDYTDHMQECMADGHKEYVCASILRGGDGI